MIDKRETFISFHWAFSRVVLLLLPAVSSIDTNLKRALTRSLEREDLASEFIFPPRDPAAHTQSDRALFPPLAPHQAPNGHPRRCPRVIRRRGPSRDAHESARARVAR